MESNLKEIFFVGLIASVLSIQAVAFSPVWSPAGTTVPGDQVAFFTHSSTKWDFQGHGATGVNALADWAESLQIARVYLMDEYNGAYYLAKAPDFLFQSNSGEFVGEVGARDVYFAGAYLEACLSQTVRDVIAQTTKVNSGQNLKITFVTDGIRSGEAEMIEDPEVKAKFSAYYSKNPYVPLNLQEDLDVIADADKIQAYLVRFLDHRSAGYNLSGISHEILVSYQGTVFATYRAGTSGHTMTFDFSDSGKLSKK